ELVYQAGLTGPAPWITVVVALLANVCMVVVAGVVTVRVFFGAPGSHAFAHAARSADPAPALLVGPVVLAVAGLIFGLAPQYASPLLRPAADAVAGHAIAPALEAWQGWNPLLALSVLTLVMGVLLFRYWAPLR